MPFGEARTDNTAFEKLIGPCENESLKPRELSGFWRVCHNVLLVAAFTGNETCVSFTQLYEVSLLQILGVPITYVSLYPVVSGPLAMILLNLCGYFSDRGSNHQKKKIVVLVFVSVIMVCGIALLVMANLIVLFKNQSSNMTDSTNDPLGSENTHFKNNSLSTVINVSFGNVSGDVSLVDSGMTTQGNHATMQNEEDYTEEDGSSLPLTAFLGLAGFGLMDIAYDISLAATRSCVLSCSAKSDHTFILTLAIAMAALGGSINNLLGLVDLSTIFPFSDGEGSLVAQSTTQLMIYCVMLIICLLSTSVTALINIHSLHNSFSPPAEDNTTSQNTYTYGTIDEDRKEEQYLGETETWLEATLYNSFSDMENIKPEEVDKFVETTQIFRKPRSISMTEDTASQISCSSIITIPPLTAGIIDLSETIQRLSPESSLTLCSHMDTDVQELQSWGCCQWSKHKMNFIIACFVSYLGASVFYCYNLYVTDFLGKEVMGGDSYAPQDSAAFQAYEDGVTIAAGGLLTSYCCYFVLSIAQSKLLKHWGLKIDFCLSHVLMSAAIVALVLSKHVAAFYVCSVVFSFQRSAFYTVPFVIANNYVHEQEKLGKAVTGKTMAVVTCMVPLCYCTAFVISGPLITFTQYDGAPLLLASLLCGLAALLFLFLYKQ